MSLLRRNLKIAAAVCLAADLALAGWLLSPRAPSRAAARQRLQLARVQLAAARARAARVRLLQSRLRISQGQIRQLLAPLPQQADASSVLLQSFGRIAAASQVRVSGAEFQPDRNARLGLRRIAIRLQVAGGYQGVVGFLNQLERSPLFLIINQVTVSGAATAGPAASPDQVRLPVQLEAYVRTQAPQP